MDISTLQSQQLALINGDSAANQAGTTLTDNFDTFLTLLTTQLQNQDPLEPMDSNQFTEQLVQFSAVEQAIATNQNLEALLATTILNNASQAVSYLGKEVEAIGATSELSEGAAEWSFTLAADAPDTRLVVTSPSGLPVFATSIDGKQGANTFTWDGRNNDGVEQPDGLYIVSIAANDADGEPVASTVQTSGLVSAVDLTDTDPLLSLGSVNVRLSEVLAIREPAAVPAP